MTDLDQAVQTQLNNIQKNTGKSLDELYEVIKSSGLAKHGEIVKMLKADLSLGHGNANLITTLFLREQQAASDTAKPDDPLDAIYTGSKAPLRPLHDAVMQALQGFGEFAIAPKKTYLSLRRRKQFATVGPGTKGRLEIGLNMKDVPATERLQALPPGKMCQYRIFLTAADEIDDGFLAWARQAFDSAA